MLSHPFSGLGDTWRPKNDILLTNIHYAVEYHINHGMNNIVLSYPYIVEYYATHETKSYQTDIWYEKSLKEYIQ